MKQGQTTNAREKRRSISHLLCSLFARVRVLFCCADLLRVCAGSSSSEFSSGFDLRFRDSRRAERVELFVVPQLGHAAGLGVLAPHLALLGHQRRGQPSHQPTPTQGHPAGRSLRDIHAHGNATSPRHGIISVSSSSSATASAFLQNQSCECALTIPFVFLLFYFCCLRVYVCLFVSVLILALSTWPLLLVV